MEWKKELEIAENAALKAGNILRKLNRGDILDTSGRDVKHQSDVESEKTILALLENESEYPVLAEESGEHRMTQSDTLVWIIDPLDGTLNYTQKISFCCVSIALWQGKNPILGVVYDFNHEELFSGIVGKGAWCNSSSIKASQKDSPQEAVLTTGFPVNRDFSSKSLQDFLSQIVQFKKIRLLGSAALSLAYVACGRVDAYTEEDIMTWDVAAGIALVKAAGGYIKYKNSEQKKWAKTVWAGNVFKTDNKRKPL